MKTILSCLLLWTIPGVVYPSGEPAVNATPAKLPQDHFRHTPESFRNQAPGQKALDRANLDHGLLSAAIFHATNQQRARHKLPLLAHSEAVRRAAQGHSRSMALGGFFSHQNPKDPARKTPWQRLDLEGVRGGFRSENIAKTPVQGLTYLSAADAIVAQWMKSPGHRRNILDRNMRFLGCGVHAAASPHFYVLATQNFSSVAPN